MALIILILPRDTAREYCQEKLQPRVLDAYRNEGMW